MGKVPEISRKVRSSSVLVDEERFPWLGKDAYCPLSPPERQTASPQPSLGGTQPLEEIIDPYASGTTSINDTPKRNLNFLNLFSGPYARANGLSDRLRYFVTDIDNNASTGGGWADDLMNDSKYALLLQRAKDGEFDSMMIAFPCTTFSIARFFDATDSRGDRGPEPIRDKQHPDGLPEDRLSPAQIKELRASNRLLDRAIGLAIAARLSPRKTTIVFENPADRTVSGTPHYMEDIPHGSFFATSQVNRFKKAVGDTSEVTFAYCRFGGDAQKCTTLLYKVSMTRLTSSTNCPARTINVTILLVHTRRRWRVAGRPMVGLRPPRLPTPTLCASDLPWPSPALARAKSLLFLQRVGTKPLLPSH